MSAAVSCRRLQHNTPGSIWRKLWALRCDVLAQRLKSLETISKGTHWSIGRQLELVRAEATGITDESEGLQAARQAREEERFRLALSRLSGARGGEAGGGAEGKKGKEWKGSGKGTSEEGQRGKGGKGKKDQKGPWQKKEK